jgi:methionyl-tRNA formyltransferase
MRLVYMGTPQYAAVILQCLLDHGLMPTLVVTQPDREAGRNRQLAAPPVKELAEQAHLPVLQPEKITHEVRERIAAERPDVLLVAAYGKILRPALLAVPSLGCLNAHASLLPAYRGAAPVNWALANGESVTGVTIMKMDEGIDTGPILDRQVVPIAADDDAATLTQRLAEAAGPLVMTTLRRWAAGEIVAQPQPADAATYAPQLKKEDGRIDWSWSARRIVAWTRGMNPWPGAFTYWQGALLKILRAESAPAGGPAGTVLSAKKELVVAAGDGAVRLLQLQLAGKKAMDAAALLNGVRLREGDRLGG